VEGEEKQMDWFKSVAVAIMVTLFLVVGYVFYVPVADMKVGDTTIIPANNVGNHDVANGVMAIATHHVQVQEVLDVANGNN
jgi:hypothetical protein